MSLFYSHYFDQRHILYISSLLIFTEICFYDPSFYFILVNVQCVFEYSSSLVVLRKCFTPLYICVLVVLLITKREMLKSPAKTVDSSVSLISLPIFTYIFSISYYLYNIQDCSWINYEVALFVSSNATCIKLFFSGINVIFLCLFFAWHIFPTHLLSAYMSTFRFLVNNIQLGLDIFPTQIWQSLPMQYSVF